MQTVAQGWDWRRRLRRSIGWMLLIKLAALVALWTFFFSPSNRVAVTPDRVDEQLLIEPAGEPPHD